MIVAVSGRKRLDSLAANILIMPQSDSFAELSEAINSLALLVEKTKPFYMEDVVLKRWILGPGGKSGNCEECIENADEGEIEESEFFPADAGLGPVDEPPLHPNCTCGIEYRDTKRRVYV